MWSAVRHFVSTFHFHHVLCFIPRFQQLLGELNEVNFINWFQFVFQYLDCKNTEVFCLRSRPPGPTTTPLNQWWLRCLWLPRCHPRPPPRCPRHRCLLRPPSLPGRPPAAPRSADRTATRPATRAALPWGTMPTRSRRSPTVSPAMAKCGLSVCPLKLVYWLLLVLFSAILFLVKICAQSGWLV